MSSSVPRALAVATLAWLALPGPPALGQEPPPEPPAATLPAPVQEGDELEMEEGPRRGGMSLAISAAGLRDDVADPAATDTPAGESAGYLLRTTLLVVARPGPRTDMSLAYQPEYERLDDGRDALEHSAGLSLDHASSPLWRTFASASWRSGEDVGRQLGGLLLLSPRRDYREARAEAGFERRWRHASFSARLEGTRLEVDPLAEGASPLAAGIEANDLGASLTWQREVASGSTLSLGYTRIEPLDAAPAGDALQSALLGWRRRIAARGELGLHAGWMESGGESDWIGAAEIGGRWERASFGLRYDRSLAALAGHRDSGLAGGAVRDSLEESLTVSWTLGALEGARWEQAVWLARTRLAAEPEIESLAAVARLVVPAARNLALFAEALYREQRGFADAGAGTRLRYAAGITLGLGGASDAPRPGYDPERLLRALPHERGGI